MREEISSLENSIQEDESEINNMKKKLEAGKSEIESSSTEFTDAKVHLFISLKQF